MSVDFADFDTMDDVKTTEAGRFKPGPEVLKDGDKWELEIEKAYTQDLKPKDGDQGGMIFKLDLQVLNDEPGKPVTPKFTLTTWVKRGVREDFASLLKTLVLLGFTDAEQWNKSDEKFSGKFPKALKAMKGMRFCGKKRSNPKADGKGFWHNLDILGRLDNDAKPLVVGPAELDEMSSDVDPDDPFA